MTVGPIVKLYFTNGAKKKIELYNRPPMITLRFLGTDGAKLEVPFVRWGPDEYKQMKTDGEVDLEKTEKAESLIIKP